MLVKTLRLELRREGAIMLLRPVWLASILLVLVRLGAVAQEPAADDAEAAKKFRAAAKASAGAYELRAESAEGRKLELREEPLLRWSNPLGGRNAHGDVFLWIDEGRPAAVLSLYEYNTPTGTVQQHHEFCSLATTAIVGKGPANRNWSPAEPGITLAVVPKAPPPAVTAIRRLSQMRDIGSRIRGAKVTREEQEKRDLRLLPQPLWRYSSKHHGIVDGALFALVEATDPEAFVLLEARESGGKTEWHYAFARMNSLWLGAQLDDASVWEVDQLPWSEVMRRGDKTYMVFPIR
jgi:hypothetical protein